MGYNGVTLSAYTLHSHFPQAISYYFSFDAFSYGHYTLPPLIYINMLMRVESVDKWEVSFHTSLLNSILLYIYWIGRGFYFLYLCLI